MRVTRKNGDVLELTPQEYLELQRLEVGESKSPVAPDPRYATTYPPQFGPSLINPTPPTCNGDCNNNGCFCGGK